MPLRTCTLLGISLALAGPARAVDRQDTERACFPPVQAVIDPDWQREAQRFKLASLTTFSRFAGGDEAGRAQLRTVLRLAESTRVPALDLIQMTRELYLRGFRDRELDEVRGAALDLWSSQGGEAAARFIRILAGIKTRGTSAAEDVRDLDPIISKVLVREALERRQVKEAGLPADVFLQVALEALTRQLGQKRPGEAAQRALRACVATMSRSCPRREAEEHCSSTPKEYLALMWQGL